LKELDQIIANEEKELAHLVKGSEKLKEKVKIVFLSPFYFKSLCLIIYV